MKYYFLTTGNEYGAGLPTAMVEDYNIVLNEFNNMDEDDYFYIGIYCFDTTTLNIEELINKRIYEL